MTDLWTLLIDCDQVIKTVCWHNSVQVEQLLNHFVTKQNKTSVNWTEICLCCWQVDCVDKIQKLLNGKLAELDDDFTRWPTADYNCLLIEVLKVCNSCLHWDTVKPFYFVILCVNLFLHLCLSVKIPQTIAVYQMSDVKVTINFNFSIIEHI